MFAFILAAPSSFEGLHYHNPLALCVGRCAMEQVYSSASTVHGLMKTGVVKYWLLHFIAVLLKHMRSHAKHSKKLHLTYFACTSIASQQDLRLQHWRKLVSVLSHTSSVLTFASRVSLVCCWTFEIRAKTLSLSKLLWGTLEAFGLFLALNLGIFLFV